MQLVWQGEAQRFSLFISCSFVKAWKLSGRSQAVDVMRGTKGNFPEGLESERLTFPLLWADWEVGRSW